MNTKCILAVALAAAAFAAQGGEKVVKTGDKLVFMGDSITEFGKNRTHGYVNLVVKGLAANGINPTWTGVGIQGDTSGDMLARFDRDVVAENPDVVTISAGVNDIYKRVAFATFCQNERAMVAKVEAAGAKAVLLSPTTAGYGEPDTDELRKFAASEGMPRSRICLIESPATACASAAVRLTVIVAVEDGGTMSGTSVSSAFHAASAADSSSRSSPKALSVARAIWRSPAGDMWTVSHVMRRSALAMRARTGLSGSFIHARKCSYVGA